MDIRYYKYLFIVKSLSTNMSTKSMKFGSASRMGKSSPALLTNAPLYNPDFQTVRSKSPNYSFGSKPVVSNKNNTPAPGDYNPKDNFSSTQPVSYYF